MAGLLLLAIVLIVGAFVLVLARAVRPLRELRVSENLQLSARNVQIRSTARNSISIAVGVVTSVALVAINIASHDELRRLVVTTALLAAAAAIAVFIVIPSVQFSEPRGVRSAELDPRRPRDFVPRWVLILPIVASALLAVVIVLTGIAAEPDGQSIAHRYNDMGGAGAGPYPGFYYGLPILVALLILMVVTFVAIVRVAAAPRPTDVSLRSADDAVRSLTIRSIAKVAAASATITLGVVLIAAGSATLRVGGEMWYAVGAVETTVPADPWLTFLGTSQLILGVCAFLGGLGLLSWAIAAALRRPYALVETDPVPA